MITLNITKKGRSQLRCNPLFFTWCAEIIIFIKEYNYQASEVEVTRYWIILVSGKTN